MESAQPWIVEVNQKILGQNARFAEENRRRFREAGVLVLNLLSSPGSGKTALLERTLTALAGRLRVGVHVGDLRTDNDARRLSGKGAPVVQIVTGGTCHLEASMVATWCAPPPTTWARTCAWFCCP
jgi:hydrogenase nickel incorporation protein HypB